MATGITLSLVIGRDGSTRLHGSSRALSSPEDRARFLAHRRTADAIVIGGGTARAESYEKSPAPLIIVSRTLKTSNNPRAHIWRCTPREALDRAITEYGSHLHIEGGPQFFSQLLDKISRIYLTISDKSGGENCINWREIFSAYAIIQQEEINGSTFLILEK